MDLVTNTNNNSFRWKIKKVEGMPLSISPSSNYKDGVWLQYPNETNKDFEERILRQRLLRGKGGSPLSSKDLLQFLKPEYNLIVKIEYLKMLDSKRLVQNSLNLKPAFSGFFFLIDPMVVIVPCFQAVKVFNLKVNFPSCGGFIWYQGETHTIRWSGCVRDSSISIVLVWKASDNRSQNQVLSQHLASSGFFCYKMPNNSPVGDSFRIRIISDIEGSAESCCFSIREAIAKDYFHRPKITEGRYRLFPPLGAAARVYMSNSRIAKSILLPTSHTFPKKLFDDAPDISLRDAVLPCNNKTNDVEIEDISRFQNQDSDENLQFFDLAMRSARRRRALEIEAFDRATINARPAENKYEGRHSPKKSEKVWIPSVEQNAFICQKKLKYSPFADNRFRVVYEAFHIRMFCIWQRRIGESF